MKIYRKLTGILDSSNYISGDYMLAITLLIISTIIGAGFATGAELASFFGSIAIPPIIISVIIGIFLLSIISVLIFCARTPGKHVKKVFAIVYFGIFIVMTAGLANLCGIYITIISLVFCIAIVCFGFDKLLLLNNYLISFVLVILISVCLINYESSASYEPQIGITGSILSALLYAGMNCCLIELVIAKCLQNNSPKKVFLASCVAVITICCLIWLILSAIKGIAADMPIISLSNNIITKAAVFFSILTSMYICLYNIYLVFGVEKKKTLAKVTSLSILCSISFGFSFFGFLESLGVIYPILGGCMILYTLWLFFRFLFNLSRRYFFSRKLLIINNSINSLDIVKNE